MDNHLYFLSNGSAMQMNETPYETEDKLQALIAANPQLLLRDKEQDGARLLLIGREFVISEGEGSDNSYALDHLFVDQNGVPVLVEVKRSTDTRIRREVIAQMMDYASRASTWNVDGLRTLFRENNSKDDIRQMYDTDVFWEQVAACLKAERIKLVFAADNIPNTLKTLIEFLDRNMGAIEVYGVEIHQYQMNDISLLSTNIVGETSLKPKSTVSYGSIEWNAARFSAYLTEKEMDDMIPIIQDLQDYAASLGIDCIFGRGAQRPTLNFKLNGQQLFDIMGWCSKSKGNRCEVEICIRDLLTVLPENSWDDKSVRSLFMDMPGRAKAEQEHLLRNPPSYLYIDLRTMLNENNLAHFKSAIKTLRDAIIQPKLGIMYPLRPDFGTSINPAN